ncbi:DUF3168 domain-containing protein [Streptomyces sp. NBC_00827]|uniref:DUF3168 domain-containing protein n=1 Tax=Streptomyces sp. NBC_00827 TaxID=2903677 RepID=UPI00386C26BC|nr:DUF3168 domain-containing protein [Streptomyces sp. NBC_00827]
MSTPIPGLAALPVRDGVRAALLADEPLTALVRGVFDWVPEKQAYPYIHMGGAVETPDNAHDRHGSQTVITLDIWSQYRGYAQALTIASRVLQALDHTPLVVVGHVHRWTRFMSLQTLTDPEPPGDIRHVPMDFRIGTEVDPA